ncbi:LuxR family transcriptional regulator [Roseovarius indicus]|jgi:LuxR family transcriptional regulator|uniref:LuxR family transcriptional regulator n=1 Tax=Roseovarius indicus TaxID=540747 RepID=A0A0T5PAU1_9RHOB|nr:LuxR family transcriptional regulator [Roseovarius indicus]KRS18275.1 LuxR family transcriptional regulator [Roseovarius indicus]OAO05877.1 LuxR family transcriptional regulator [Roseovarius indicus]QEW26886.1 Transcriptional activator protein LuxR [Roseovarius indicus]SFD58380.1 LuxR family transcriptional regulator [Roseovarius indicus]
MIPADELNALITAHSIETLWDRHTRHMAEYGFDRLIYGFTRYMTPNSLGDPDDFILLSNHDPAYMDRFIGEGLYFHAPMVRWALENDGARSWSLLQDMIEIGALTADERKVIEFNRSMGVVAGYSISFKPVSSRAKGAIALTARQGMTQAEVEEIWAQHGEDILLLNNLTHLRIMTLPYTGPARTLTSRQREVLEWVGDGKTVQDTAVIMGLTPPTVEKHLRLARQALNVETTAQAVLKAAFQNQIFVLER